MTKKSSDAKKAVKNTWSFWADDPAISNDQASISAFYADLRSKSDPEKLPTPEIMEAMASQTGTHLVKLVSPKINSRVTGTVLSFQDPEANHIGELYPSVDSKNIPFAKLLHHPVNITGSGPRSLADHILCPDDNTECVKNAFAESFGAECLAVIYEALHAGPSEVTSLPARNFPIIFTPNPKGGDLQLTPLSPAHLMREMYDLEFKTRDLFFEAISRNKDEKATAKAEGRDAVLEDIPAKGDWSEQTLSSQPQNISGKIPVKRLRFDARVPQVLQNYEAGIWSLMHGGKFPKIDDAGLQSNVIDYADRLAAHDKYNNQDTRRALDWCAEMIIGTAFDFIADVLNDLTDLKTSQGVTEVSEVNPPILEDLIFSSFWWRDDRDRVRSALSSEHFAKIKKGASK